MPNNEGGKAQRDYRTVLYVGCFFVGGGGGGRSNRETGLYAKQESKWRKLLRIKLKTKNHITNGKNEGEEARGSRVQRNHQKHQGTSMMV